MTHSTHIIIWPTPPTQPHNHAIHITHEPTTSSRVTPPTNFFVKICSAPPLPLPRRTFVSSFWWFPPFWLALHWFPHYLPPDLYFPSPLIPPSNIIRWNEMYTVKCSHSFSRLLLFFLLTYLNKKILGY